MKIIDRQGYYISVTEDGRIVAYKPEHEEENSNIVERFGKWKILCRENTTSKRNVSSVDDLIFQSL